MSRSQREHDWLIGRAAKLLEPDGELLFATDLKSFELVRTALGAVTGGDHRGGDAADFASRPGCGPGRYGGRES